MIVRFKSRDGAWDRFSVCWRPDWRTGRQRWYRGIVRGFGLRLGPLGFVWLRLATKAETQDLLDSKGEQG